MEGLLNELTPEQRVKYFKEYETHKKNRLAAYILCFFLGAFGAHEIYLEKRISGIARAVVFLISCYLITEAGEKLSTAAVWIAIGLIVWAWVDLFRLKKKVNVFNDRLSERIIAKLLGKPVEGKSNYIANRREEQKRKEAEAKNQESPYMKKVRPLADELAALRERVNAANIKENVSSLCDITAEIARQVNLIPEYEPMAQELYTRLLPDANECVKRYLECEEATITNNYTETEKRERESQLRGLLEKFNAMLELIHKQRLDDTRVSIKMSDTNI